MMTLTYFKGKVSMTELMNVDFRIFHTLYYKAWKQSLIEEKNPNKVVEDTLEDAIENGDITM